MANQYPLFVSSYDQFPGNSSGIDQALSFYTTTAVLNAELAAKVDVTSGTATNLTVNTGLKLPFASAGLLQVDGAGVVSGGGGGGAGAGLASNNTFTGTNNFTGGLSQNSNAFSVGGALTTGGAFTTTPANALTLTTTGSTNVTLPTTGTLAALNGTNTYTGASTFTNTFTINNGTALNQISSTNTNCGLNIIATANQGKQGITITQSGGAIGSQRLMLVGQVNGSFNGTAGGGYLGAFSQPATQLPIYIDTGARTCIFTKAAANMGNQTDSAIYGSATAIAANGGITTAGGNPAFSFQNTIGTALFTNLTNTPTTTTNKTINFPDATGQIPLGTAGNTLFFTTGGATNLTLPVSGMVPTGTVGNAINLTTTGATNLTLPTTGTVATLEGANTWGGTNIFQGTLQQGSRVLILGSGTDTLAIQTAGSTNVTLPTSGTLAALNGVNTWGGSQNFSNSGLTQGGRSLALGSNSDSLVIQTVGNTNVSLPTGGTLAAKEGANTWSSTNNFTGTLQQNGRTLTLGSTTDTLTLNTAGNTSVTLPTTGTLATLGGTNTWSGTTNTFSGGQLVVNNTNASVQQGMTTMTSTNAAAGSVLNIYAPNQSGGKQGIVVSGNSATFSSQRQLLLGQVNTYNGGKGGGYIGAYDQATGDGLPVYIEGVNGQSIPPKSVIFPNGNSALANADVSANNVFDLASAVFQDEIGIVGDKVINFWDSPTDVFAKCRLTVGGSGSGSTIVLPSTVNGVIALSGGGFTTIFTSSANASVTIPTSGTLAALGGTNTWTGNNNFTGGLQQNGANVYAGDRANVYWLSTSVTSTVAVSSMPTNVGTRITNVSNTLTLAAGSKYTLSGTIIGITNTANSGQFVTFTVSGATGVTLLPNTTSNSSTFAGYNLIGSSQPQMAISFTMFIDGTSASGAFAVTPTQFNWNGTKIEIMGKVVTDN